MSKNRSKLLTNSFFFIFILTISIIVFIFKSSTKYASVTIEKDYIKDIVQHDNFSNQVHTDSQWGNPRGIGIGFVWPEERNTPPENRSQTEEIYLGNKKSFDPLNTYYISKGYRFGQRGFGLQANSFRNGWANGAPT